MLAEYPTIEDLKALCEQHPDLVVMLDDSFAAGNCEEGIMDFVEDYFPGRKSVAAKELVPHLDYRGVQLVLEYVFRQLEGQGAEDSAKLTVQPSEDTQEDDYPF